MSFSRIAGAVFFYYTLKASGDAESGLNSINTYIVTALISFIF
jgi:hypothetical protein